MHAHTVEKHPTVAFLLSLIPGVGHLYLGKYIRTLLYGGAAAAPLALLVLFTLAEGFAIEAFSLAAVAVFFVWCVNMIDMAITLTLRKPYAPSGLPEAPSPRRDRTIATMLSLLPGIGHIYLGRSRRGLTLLLAAAACGIVPLLAALALGEETMLLGWFAVPALVAFAAIDAAEAAKRSEYDALRPEDDFDAWFVPGSDGRRPVVALFLSLVPGVGHLYLGSLFAGLRQLGALLLLLFLKREYGIDLAVYALPLLWCWAFFDVLRRVSPGGFGGLDADEPPVWSSAVTRWAGIGLIVLGGYVAFDRIVVSAALEWLPNAEWLFRYRRWAEPMLIAGLFLGVGLELLRGRHRS
ncbi:hypothetical protein [Paenibacillus sp.]|uniref:hypothetical protein n=1 Tax=Paenibacillus sp. TaxID=58172 RepID=UPI00281130B6|nr:hypothetical protein [Paenibacillus sp.]